MTRPRDQRVSTRRVAPPGVSENKSRLRSSFHLLIGRERHRLGITQRELARRMGVTEAFVSNLLNRRSNPTMETVAAVAAAMGCAVTIDFVPDGLGLDITEVAAALRARKETDR